MRIDKKWIVAADKALIATRIVQGQTYAKPYKGYFSSYGAAIVQSGLLAASRFFEDETAQSESDRSLVVKAVVEVLNKMGCMDKERVKSLAYHVFEIKDNEEKARLLYATDKAIAALKLTLRQYTQADITVKAPHCGRIVEAGTSRILTEDEFKKEFIDIPYSGNSNMGWLYYRDYYRKFDFKPQVVSVESENNGRTKREKKGTERQLYFKKQNQRIISSTFTDFKYNEHIIESLGPTHKLYFQTLYPGLLIGSGLSHGTGETNDMKIGFAFDYTTGLPYIPGSSVKGVLRSMFPKKKPEENSDDPDPKYDYILEKSGIPINLPKKKLYSQIWKLTCFVFNEYQKGLEGASRNTYFDALIVRTENPKKHIVGEDYITPHREPLKNPKPLQFLKVLAQVTFCFSFKLKQGFSLGDQIIDVPELFKNILLDTGVGAKTNVGYGNLCFVKEENGKNP